jgi:hypothetical protein
MAHGKSLPDRKPPGGVSGTIETADETFFADHPDRKYRIRLPASDAEFHFEFETLGPHESDRRRIIVARVPPGLAMVFHLTLMPIPFLAFADETIEDRDDIIGPIFKGIMANAGAGLGVNAPGGLGWW